MAALSTAIKNIQKEMNPYASISGMPLGSTENKATMIDKVYTTIVNTASKSLTVNCSALASTIPDGAKILSIKATNLSGRTLILTVPSGSALMLTQDQSASAPLPALSRLMVAPLSRFPVIKCNIPDLLAKPIDTGAGNPLFTLGTDGQTDSVLLRFHVKIAI